MEPRTSPQEGPGPRQRWPPNCPLLQADLMDYLGDKLSVAQTHMTQWVGTVRRSFQEALHLVTATVGAERSGEPAGRTPFKRASSFRHLASRSRESFRRFSARSQQRFSSLRKRQPDSEAPDLVSLGAGACVCFKIAGQPREGPFPQTSGRGLIPGWRYPGRTFSVAVRVALGPWRGRVSWPPWRCSTRSLRLVGNSTGGSVCDHGCLGTVRAPPHMLTSLFLGKFT